MEKLGAGTPDELLAFVTEQLAEGGRGVKACPAVVVARAGGISEQPALSLTACEAPGGFIERPLETLALLGELGASLLKRLVGLPVRPLRPLEFASDALEACSEPPQLLLNTLTVGHRPGKLLAGSRLLRPGALKLPLQPSALLGEPGASLLKRLVGLPVRPLRPLEFASKVLEARSEPPQLLLNTLTVGHRPGKLLAGSRLLRPGALKLPLQRSLHAIALGHSLREVGTHPVQVPLRLGEGASGVAELLFGSVIRGLRIADLLGEALPTPPGVVQLRAPRDQLSCELCDAVARLVELLRGSLSQALALC